MPSSGCIQYLEVDDELELGAALLLGDGGDGELLHALQQATHHARAEDQRDTVNQSTTRSDMGCLGNEVVRHTLTLPPILRVFLGTLIPEKRKQGITLSRYHAMADILASI